MNDRGILTTINGLIIETEIKLISTIILVLLIWLLRSVVLRVLWQRVKDDRTRGLARQIVGYTAFILGLVLIGRLWLEGFQSLLIVLTLIFSALIVTLKELILNLASRSIIAWRQLFKIGDRIRIGEHYGEVVEMNMIYFTLISADDNAPSTLTGNRIIKIPNHCVLSQPIINEVEGSPLLWYEIKVALTLDSDWHRAQELLTQFLRNRLADLELETELTASESQQVYCRVQAGKILLFGRYLCDAARHAEVERLLWQDVLTGLHNQDRLRLA
jgi:small-conductance mechanosensitive channel